MQAKTKERETAIRLRKNGLSYREILEQISVAKSSLSLWLRSVKLAKRQEQRISEKKRLSALRGAFKRRADRIALTIEIKDSAKKEVGLLTSRELWLVGIALYWAEGSKEKDYRPGSRTEFSNSDPRMIKTYLSWLTKAIEIPKEKVYFSIYVHENHKNRVSEIQNYWSKQTGYSKNYFKYIYFKKNKIHTKRRNTGNNYFGLVRVAVKESSNFNRKIQGWIEGIHQHSGVV